MKITDLADVQAGDTVIWSVPGLDVDFKGVAEEEPNRWLTVGGAVLRSPMGRPGYIIEFIEAYRDEKPTCICNPVHRADDPVCRYQPETEEVQRGVTTRQVLDVIALSRNLGHAANSMVEFLRTRGLIINEED